MKSTLKRTTTTITEENVSRYLNALNDMKKSLDNDARFSMKGFINDYKLSYDLPKVLTNGKIIRNTKTGRNPEWEWLSIKPNRLMATRTLDELKKVYQSRNERNLMKKKNQEEVSDMFYEKLTNNSVNEKPKPKRKYTKKKVIEGYEMSLFFGLLKINIKPIYKTK